jgi:hypothetical protein
MSMLEWGAIGALALIYGGSGLAELPMWRKTVDQFVQWGYPRWFAIFNPALKLVAGVMVLFTQTRPIGVALCVLVGLAALATVLRFRTRSMYPAVIPVVLLTLASAAVLLLPSFAGG